MAPRGLRLLAYLWRLELARAAAAFALLLGVYVLIDAVETASAARLTLGQLATAYPLKLPVVAVHVAALGCALGALLTLGALRRRGEWDAAAAAGIAPAGMAAGLAVVPLACALVVLPVAHELAPRAMARFEARTGRAAAAPAATDTWWSRDGDRLTKWRDAGGAGGAAAAISIERDGDGRARSWRGDCGAAGGRCEWRRDAGWREGGAAAIAALAGDPPRRAPTAGAYGFVGGSLGSAELAALCAELERHGQGAARMRAELALRTALAAGVLLVPALALALAFAFGVARATRLVAVALLCGAAYWLALAAAWNGAAAGAFAPEWVSVGVPVGFAAFAAVTGAWAAATRRT